MRRLRATVRLALVAGLTASLALGLVLLMPVAVVARSRVIAWRSVCFRAWARGVARILGARVTVDGKPPPAPFFLVTNHLGYFDVVVLVSRLPCFFVAKSEVARWPVIGLLARALNTIFVDRTQIADVPRVLARMQCVLEEGQGVVFFPEGTSSPGEEVLPFRPALFEAPVRSGYPVSCASLLYETPTGEPPARTAVCWWGDMAFFDHLFGLAKLARFDVLLVFGDAPVTGSDRGVVAERAHERVRQLHRPPGASPEKD